jgi:hypothetical protein
MLLGIHINQNVEGHITLEEPLEEVDYRKADF